MDNRPIGVFDSGVGGLTAVRQLTALLPSEDIIYLGDTGRVPYGTRSRDTIIRCARQDMAFLRTFDLKAVVVACGTVSSSALALLQAENQLPLLGVVAPAARQAAQCSRTGRIGVIGTAATIRTGAFERAISALRPDAVFCSAACPLFVPLAENGRIHPGDPVVETVAAEYLAPMHRAEIDTLVLGCTHYPLLREVLARQMGPAVQLIDAGAAAAAAMAEQLAAAEQLADPARQGSCRFFVSGDPEGFSKLAALFLQRCAEGLAQRVTLPDAPEADAAASCTKPPDVV